MLDLIRQESQLQQSLAYNYDQVDAAHRPAVIAAALEIKPRVKRASEDLLVIGQQLNAVKSMLPHGEWGNWLNAEFSLSDRSAQNFMNIAERFAGKSATVALLSSSVLGLLAAPSTPEAAVAELVATATTSGHGPTKAEAQAVIAKHKPEPVTYASVWQIEQAVKLWLTALNAGPEESYDKQIAKLTIARDAPSSEIGGALVQFLDKQKIAYRLNDLRQAINNINQQLRDQNAPRAPARPANFIAATPRGLTKEETLAVVARGLAAARPTGSNADQIAWLAASQLADFTPLLTARVFIDPTYLAQAKRQLEADLKSRSKTSEPVGEPADPTTMVAPPDLAAHGWTLRKTADKWWGHVPQGNRATAMFSDVPSAVAAMRAMQANLAPPAPPSERLELEGLLRLYQEVLKSIPRYTKITGDHPDGFHSDLAHMVAKLQAAFLAQPVAPEGRPTL